MRCSQWQSAVVSGPEGFLYRGDCRERVLEVPSLQVDQRGWGHAIVNGLIAPQAIGLVQSAQSADELERHAQVVGTVLAQ